MSRHGEIAEFVEVESAKRNDRPQRAVMVFAKKRKATLPRSPIGSFIATLMNSKGVDLAIAGMPEANWLMLHVLIAAAEHE